MSVLPDLESRTRASRVLRGVSLGLAALSAVGLAALSAPTEARAADDDSAVTVAWTGDTGDLAQYQPDRDPASIHYGDFADLQVSVSRTRDLVDEAVSVTVTGMPGATQRLSFGGGGYAELGANFVQTMQCWGDPGDPEFYQNCQWGAMGLRGAGDAAPSVSSLGNQRSGELYYDVPFRAVTGTRYSSLLQGGLGEDTELLQVVSPQTTNERTTAVDATGTSRFEFEVQSAASQPYLGCGDESSATGTRCWLVVVPRGVHNSPPRENCNTVTTGRRGSLVRQDNSPINPNCDYWANRVVVPLDFRPTGATCPAGSAEQRVVGTDSIQAAFASWQTALCRQLGTVYTLTTSADPLAREQLLTGQAQMTITPRALTPEILSAAVDPAQLAETDLAYAPVAVSGVTIAFLANAKGQIQTHLNLSPRLVAKLLTQSYALESGLYNYFYDPVPGPWKTNPLRLTDDPEFRSLNPDAVLSQGARMILTGPNASDAIGQLWAYVQTDDKARDFLAGNPDNTLPGDGGNTGMTLNPYYLPHGHPDAKVPTFVEGATESGTNIGGPRPTLLPQRDGAGDVQWREVGLTYDDGTSRCLCDAEVNTFLKADETLLPQRLDGQNQTMRYDVLQQRPYAVNVEAAARMLFRGDSGAKTLWDDQKFNGPGVSPGGYFAEGLARQTDVFLAGYTDLASATRYRLATASLQVPNTPGVFVDADAAGMGAALTAQTPTAVPGVTVTDPAGLPPTAYPLTSILYAAVNLSATDEAAREQYADLIEYAVTDGQVPGHSIGELPEGYLPLTEDLREQALDAVNTIRAYDPGDDEPDPTPTPTSTSAPNRTAPPPDRSTRQDPSQPDRAPQTGYQEAAPEAAQDTEAVTPAAAGVLGGSLFLGLAGAVASPLLLRRKVLP